MYPNLFRMPPQEKSSSVITIVIIVLVVLGCGAALFGAKIWYDRKDLGDKPPTLERAKAY